MFFNSRVIEYEKFTIITLNNVRRGWGGVGRCGSKKSKPIPVLPHGAGLKSCPIPALPTLQGEENSCGAKRKGVG